MAFLTEIFDRAGRCVTTLVTTHDKYLLPDGSRMFVPATSAWCRACREFVLAETLQDPAEIEGAAHDYFRKRSGATNAAPSLLPPEIESSVNQTAYLKLLNAAAQWRIALQSRTSPPRCLSCGGTDFIRVPEDGAWFDHPEIATGPVQARCDKHASMMRAGHLYDTEGRRIDSRD